MRATTLASYLTLMATLGLSGCSATPVTESTHTETTYVVAVPTSTGQTPDEAFESLTFDEQWDLCYEQWGTEISPITNFMSDNNVDATIRETQKAVLEKCLQDEFAL